jgi:hypothetical protein
MLKYNLIYICLFDIPSRSTLVHLPVFSGIRVTRSLVLWVCFVERCLPFCPFSSGHYVSVLLRYTDSDIYVKSLLYIIVTNAQTVFVWLLYIPNYIKKQPKKTDNSS